MSDGTKIEWAANADGTPGASWNPIVGCSVLSPGCTNCYAMREAARNERQMAALGKLSPYAGLTQPSKAGPVWTGDLILVASALRKPLGWRRPRTIFVNSMGDLFHEHTREHWLDQVFAIMALCPQHTFIVLTKRAERMRDYLAAASLERIAESVPCGEWQVSKAEAAARITGLGGELYRAQRPAWPLANVWGGVSIENVPTLYKRLPHLLDAPLATRVISFEPLLDDVAPHIGDVWRGGDTPHIDGCFVGGESGPSARPMHPNWARNLRDWARDANVAFFFKQWGEWAPRGCTAGMWLTHAGDFFGPCDSFDPRVDATCAGVERVGKRNAGRMLDGRTHDDRPPLTGARA